MLQRSLVCVYLLLGFVSSAEAQVVLEWKFKEGDTFYVENVTKTKQSLGTGGKPLEQEKTTTAVARYKVAKATSDATVLEMQFAGFKTDGKDLAAAFAPLASEPLKEITFHVTLNPAGQVTKFEGFDEFVKKMVGDNEAARAAFKAMGVEDLYAEGVNQTFGFLPGKPGAKGDSWKRSGRYPLMMLGTLKYDTEYAYQGRSDKGEAISFTEKFTYEAPKEMAGFPIKVTKADVKVDTRAGSILFDPTAGRLIQHERSFRFKGTFTREAGEKRQRSTWTRRVPPPSVC